VRWVLPGAMGFYDRGHAYGVTPVMASDYSGDYESFPFPLILSLGLSLHRMEQVLH